MKRSILAGSAFALMALHAPAAHSASAVQVNACWIRAMPPTLPSSGYFTVKNDGDAPIALTGIDTPAFGMAMLHETQTSGSTSKMVHVESVEVPAHGVLTFKPKSYHAMLEQPRQAVTPGTKVPLTLHFAGGLMVSATCDVKAPSFSGQSAGNPE
ncbi:copper chaperone PCu(A)C [Burkholderia stagnalis]|uniref:copper chaperone PCu(A)C n=1 Tax=Burkholderia stagnalis TaxID=1503054 RepID=UPI00075A9E00|nr:copper chaperone PCu(A)C [Burkholderia stagnalis]KVC52928.1 copper transporter [Burkholderia stagnalis]KVN20861.1 copper transporter [Burkholderia stagnalis]KVO61232.1 copper transporter [Burkholderia stagnalis]KVP12836.1 copper transporter [Burkholderia stagnalis]KVW96346.1 copper transporter [Burkholderia stagnalis]